MANDIKIYGAVRAMTEDGKAAYAEQVYDSNKGKFQGTINSEMETGKQDVIPDLNAIRAGAAAGATAAQPSDLTNFITKNVNDLVNYYLKSETYTKTEVQAIVSAIKQFTYQLADELPTASASTMNIIYLVPSADPQQQNVKDEFITIATTSGGTTTYSWEQIGSTAIDLSGYYTSAQTDAAITAALNTALASYYTSTQVDAAITTALGSYYTKTETDTLFDEKANYDGYYSGMAVGSAEGLIGSTVSSGQFLYRQTNGGVPVAAGLSKINGVKGSTVVWNQIGEATNSSSEVAGITRTKIDSATIKISGECTGTNNFTISKSYAAIVGHKYASIIDKVISGVGINYAANIGKRIIIENASTTSKSFGLYITSGTSIDETLHPNVIDLTKMFGSDAQIAAALGIQEADITTDTGVAAFESWLAQNVGLKDYYPYNAGELIPVKITGLKTVGFNQWDEEWELGAIRGTDGTNQSNNNSFRSKNYIPVFPDTAYYLKVGGSSITSGIQVRYYDVDKKYIGASDKNGNTNGANDIRVMPSNAHYIRFNTVVGSYSGGNVYQHDICINLSDTAKNGTYEPYWTDEASLPVTTLTGKLNGEGESVVVFPDGLKKAGYVYDEIKVENGVTKAIKRIGSVDLGSLNWIINSAYDITRFIVASNSRFTTSGVWNNCICDRYSLPSNDTGSQQGDKTIKINSTYCIIARDDSYSAAEDFKTAVSGVYFYYELATPEEYILDADPVTMKVDPAGTEQVLPENTTNIVTCAPTLDIVYPFDMGSKEDKGNKVTSISSESTDEQYPSAKTVYDSVKAVSDTVERTGVYDVTANNSGATFASLSALLSDANLDTLIPTAVRHGGMEIRFVNSSDNKYVQFRYMLPYVGNTTSENNKFVNVANWQGVDDEPTAGSDNLIKSGGVYPLQTKVIGERRSDTYVVSGYFQQRGSYNFKKDVQYNFTIDCANQVTIYFEIKDSGGTTIRTNTGYSEFPQTFSWTPTSNYDGAYLRLGCGSTISCTIGVTTKGLEDDVLKLLNNSVQVTAQSFSSEEKAQALTNLGVTIDTTPQKDSDALITSGAVAEVVEDDETRSYKKALNVTGADTTFVDKDFKTVVGHQYEVVYPDNWTISNEWSDGLAVFEIRYKNGNNYTAIKTIQKADFQYKGKTIQFVSDYENYRISVRATTGNQTVFYVRDLDFMDVDSTPELCSANPISGNGVTLSLYKKADLMEVNGLSVAETLATSFVRFSDGDVRTVSIGTVYKIDLTSVTNIKRVYIEVGYTNNDCAAIAFYSGTPSTTTYISNKSIRLTKFEKVYAAEIPNNAKYLLVTNASSVVASPVIKLYKDEYIKEEKLSQVEAKVDTRANFENVYPANNSTALIYHFQIGGLGNTAIIPSQSLFDVRIAGKLGFKAIELNVMKLSDDTWICRHGDANNMITGLIDINGDYVTDPIDPAEITYPELKANYRYYSSIPGFRGPVATLEETLIECKKYGITPMIRWATVTQDAIDIVEKHFGKRYIALKYPYDGSSRPDNSWQTTICRSTIGTTLTLAQHKALINSFGAPYIHGVDDISNLTDAELIELLDYAHERGCGICMGGGYSSETVNQKAFDLGADAMASGWNVPEFELGNKVNLIGSSLKGFSDFTLSEGATTDTDGSVVLAAGESISYTGSSITIGKALLDVIFEGNVKVTMGKFIVNTAFEEDNIKERVFTSIMYGETLSFTITAVAESRIYNVEFKGSEIL